MDKVLFSSASEEWATPDNLFNELNYEYHFDLDPCCTHENAKCLLHFTKEDDGLSKNWGGGMGQKFFAILRMVGLSVTG